MTALLHHRWLTWAATAGVESDCIRTPRGFDASPVNHCNLSHPVARRRGYVQLEPIARYGIHCVRKLNEIDGLADIAIGAIVIGGGDVGDFVG